MTQLSASAMTNLEVGQKAKETTINTNIELARTTLNDKPEFLGSLATVPSASGLIVGSRYWNSSAANFQTLIDASTWQVE